jgi:hypothetical protein
MEPGNLISTTRRPAWLGAAALLIASWIAVAALSLRVRAGTEVVAVAFPPWWSTQQAFLAAASANAAIVRVSALPALLVVRPDGNDGLNRLYEAGAWLAIDPQAIAACFKTENDPRVENDLRGR